MTPNVGEGRVVLQRVGAHVLGRRRHAVVGRFGLRASPGGFATPAFGPEPEVVRVSGTTLVREVGGEASTMPIDGATLRALATFAGADIDAAYECGSDTPATGDPDAPLALAAGGAGEVAAWFALGQAVLDEVVAGLGAVAGPATAQLWPEHFDLATHVGVAGGARANVGASPGDGGIDEPYLYVGPWDAGRPGDPAYWDVPFGAALRRSQLGGGRAGAGPVAAPAVGADAVAEAVAWVRRGLGLLAGG